ncbi:MAG: hypothetical protein ACKOPO_07040, partial [Novosphingobium sp.]
GAAIAGMRYFGDFERFAGLSHHTADRLAQLDDRMGHLLAAPEAAVSYLDIARLAREFDDIAFEEIEGWQSVFGGKHIAVPV